MKYMHCMKMMTYEEFGRFEAGCTKEYLVGQGGIPGTIMTVLKMMVVEGMVVERHGGRDDGDDNDDGGAGGEEGCLVRPGGMRGPNRKDAGRKRQGRAIPTNTRTQATSIQHLRIYEDCGRLCQKVNPHAFFTPARYT